MASRAVVRLKESFALPTLITGLLLSALLVSPGFAMSGKAKSEKNIVDTAAASGFTTLVTAVQAAGLEETLRGKGPFTVFAPTDAAFAKIPPAELQALLENKEALTKVLTYHVVPGRVMASDVARLSSAKTVQGQTVTINTREGVKVDDANVVQTDIVASNGVIHVIDSVILPK